MELGMSPAIEPFGFPTLRLTDVLCISDDNSAIQCLMHAASVCKRSADSIVCKSSVAEFEVTTPEPRASVSALVCCE